MNNYRIHGASGDWAVVTGLEVHVNDEQMVLNASLAIEERAGFTHRPAKWW